MPQPLVFLLRLQLWGVMAANRSLLHELAWHGEIHTYMHTWKHTRACAPALSKTYYVVDESNHTRHADCFVIIDMALVTIIVVLSCQLQASDLLDQGRGLFQVQGHTNISVQIDYYAVHRIHYMPQVLNDLYRCRVPGIFFTSRRPRAKPTPPAAAAACTWLGGCN